MDYETKAKLSGISITQRHHTRSQHLHFNKPISIELEELFRSYTRTHRRKAGLACILSTTRETSDAANSRGGLESLSMKRVVCAYAGPFDTLCMPGCRRVSKSNSG